MANTTADIIDTGSSRDSPVLHPGRPADPGGPETIVPGPRGFAAPESGIGADEGEGEESEAQAPADQPELSTQAEPGEGERRYAESRQRRLRRLLRQCERVNLMDFNVLSLSGWPDSYTLNAARRRRDSWLFSATVAALVFLSGMTGFVPPWIAGGGFGAFVVILLLGVPFIRRLYASGPSYLELILYRQQLLRDARQHVRHLEGEVGLIWQCNELSDFNPTLAAPRFSVLRRLSEQRCLAASLTRREHIRLYLIFMLEAEKAYQSMQSAFFEAHQQAIDRGWHSVARVTTGAATGSENGSDPGQGKDVSGQSGDRPQESAQEEGSNSGRA